MDLKNAIGFAGSLVPVSPCFHTPADGSEDAPTLSSKGMPRKVSGDPGRFVRLGGCPHSRGLFSGRIGTRISAPEGHLRRDVPLERSPLFSQCLSAFSSFFSASLSLSLLPAQQRHSVVVGNSLLGIYRLFLTRKRKDLHFYRLKAHQLHSSIRVIVCLWMWRQQFNVMIYCTCDSNRMIDMCQNKRITSPAANAVCDRLTIFIGFTVHMRNGLTCFGFMSK